MQDARSNGHNTGTAPVADDRRVHPRYHFTACVAAIDAKHRTTLSARTSDISRGGCYADAFCPFPVNSDVKRKRGSMEKLGACARQACYGRMAQAWSWLEYSGWVAKAWRPTRNVVGSKNWTKVFGAT